MCTLLLLLYYCMAYVCNYNVYIIVIVLLLLYYCMAYVCNYNVYIIVIVLLLLYYCMAYVCNYNVYIIVIVLLLYGIFILLLLLQLLLISICSRCNNALMSKPLIGFYRVIETFSSFGFPFNALIR